MDSRAEPVAFSASRESFEQVLSFLDGEQAGALGHGELEEQLADRGRELLRQLYQDHLDLRSGREARLEQVADVHGVPRRSVEAGHDRVLGTVFGEVTVRRLAYRRRGHANLHLADAALSLPAERHSHGLRRLAAEEASRGSFDDATATIRRATGAELGKRQVEQLAARAATDVEEFYASRRHRAVDPGDVLVLSADGKGVVMRPDALRPATAAAASTSATKLQARLSKGEKRNRKRMAEVGTVYDATPVSRTAADVMPANETERDAAIAGPVDTGKWLTASVTRYAADMIGDVFDEAERRDSGYGREWVALVG